MVYEGDFALLQHSICILFIGVCEGEDFLHFGVGLRRRSALAAWLTRRKLEEVVAEALRWSFLLNDCPRLFESERLRQICGNGHAKGVLLGDALLGGEAARETQPRPLTCDHDGAWAYHVTRIDPHCLGKFI